jgi:hypothetical protein
MVAAVGANERAALFQFVVCGFLPALFALEARSTEAHCHDVFKAGVVIREALEKLANREVRRCGRALAHAILMAQVTTCVKGIIGKKIYDDRYKRGNFNKNPNKTL